MKEYFMHQCGIYEEVCNAKNTLYEEMSCTYDQEGQ
jgi:hypothetical protein